MKLLDRLLHRQTPEPPPPSPEELRRRVWEAEDTRKEILAKAMASAVYGPELSRDELARTYRDEAIRQAARSHEERLRR